MECRFKTSNHSNEQAKRISIKVSGEEKIKRTERGCAEKKEMTEEARNRNRISIVFNRKAEDADDYDGSYEIALLPLRKAVQRLDENIWQETFVDADRMSRINSHSYRPDNEK